jgi:bla regulator protein blaR1
MNAPMVVSQIGWTLVNFVWQGAVIGSACAVALTVMRNARPEYRYALACAALLACLGWPVLDLCLRLASAAPAGTGGRFSGRVLLGAAGSGHGNWLQANLTSIVGAWAVCAAALALRMLFGLLWIGRAAKDTETDPHWQACVSRLARQFGITRAVRLRIVHTLASPVTAGWWRPVVLVPAALVSGMPPHLLEALLAHEMAHVRRFDYLVNLVQNVVETLLFYHPAVWWLSGRIRAEREQIADDLAARELGEPRRLALALSELERFQFSTHHLAQAANGGDLMSRIKRLLSPDTQALNWKAALPVLGLAAACMAMYANASPTAQAPAGDTAARVEFASCAKPVWPAQDLAAEHQGTVRLAFLISTDGVAGESKVVKSSGYPALDEAARTGIAKCHFTPATQAGKPVSAWMQMQYVWTLN